LLIKRYAAIVARPIVLHPKDASFDGEVLHLPLYMASLIPEKAEL